MSNYKNYRKEQSFETKNPKLIEEKIKSGKIPGIYCLFGDEEYMVDYYIKKILDGCKADSFDVGIFDPDNFSLDLFRDSITSYPVMSDYKIIIVKNIGDIKFKSGELESLLDILNRYKQDIEEYCCLVFKAKDLNEAQNKQGKQTTRGKKSGLSLTKYLKENADLFEFKQNPPASLIKWLIKIAASENIVLSPENAGYILTKTENKMYNLKNELDKLIRYSLGNNRNIIEKKDIDLLIMQKTELEAFELTNAILEKKYAKAIESLEKLKDSREEPVVILGQISRHFCDLVPVNLALASGISDSYAINKRTGIHEYKIKLILNSLKKYGNPGEFINKSLELCRDCDVKLKSTSLDNYSLLENLLFNISVLG
ncbi:MAG: DNA polymerase III subunit delta [Oscillospiraceae bacterium]|nr:DNA polymerase III subunit delta [Oscillospiraceae bacterium]